MTKNFSSAELKGHRDQVYDMVAKGKLPVQPQITGSEIHEISAAIIKTLNNDGNAKKLSDQAIEILLASACEQSEIKILRSEHAFTIKTGLQEFHLRTSDSKQYPEEILELAQKGYINLNEDAATLTESGIAHTQELVKVTARFIEKKIKCLKCNIHFIICSWLAENHRANKLHCPECGQSEGAFLVWAQYKFGHIFQAVPGNATLWDYGHLPKRPK
ncbi:hypothetical protein [Pseudomonas mosselii]|jgi:hypothetical protein|uniref:hypothetical protein n=1 Tax=Pseudomonas mosselii TaxID=78327 RepID=UPI0020C74B39|nr:hypothetical protein [Pseudomonas mosselii]